MDVRVSKSEIDGYIDVNIAESDYLDEFRKTISGLRGKIHRNGFRSKNVSLDVLYHEYGFEVLRDVCVNKIRTIIRDLLTQGELKDVKCFDPLLCDTSFPQDKSRRIDFTHPGNFDFKLIYAIIPEVDIDDFYNNNELKIKQKVCNILNDDIAENISRIVKFNSGLRKHKNKANEGDVIFLKSNDNIYAIPAIGCTIDGEPLHLIGKTLNDEIDLNAKDWNNVKFSEDKNYYIDAKQFLKLKPGKCNFTISDIVSYEEPTFNYDYFRKFFVQYTSDKTAEIDWLKNIDDIFIDDNVKILINNNNKENETLFDKKIKDLTLSITNNILEKEFRYKLKDDVISKLNINISKSYIKCKMGVKLQGEMLDYYIKLFINSMKWECFRGTIIKNENIQVTDDDKNLFTKFQSNIENNERYKDASIYLDRNCIPGVQDDYKNQESMILDRKIISFLKNKIHTEYEDITYDTFINNFSNK